MAGEPEVIMCWNRSCRFRQQLAFPFAHEGLERLRLRAADLFDRTTHGVVGIVRIDRRAADRPPERGEMRDSMLIIAARGRVAAPFLVGDFLITHILAE